MFSLHCRFRLVAAAVLAAAFALLPVHAQKPADAHLSEILLSLHRGHFFDQVAVSPDGKRLAWIEQNKIRVAPVGEPEKAQRLVEAGTSCHDSEFAWSPDSTALAFFSDCAEQTELYLSRFDGAAARRLTALHGYVDSPAFSPDGKSIAFLYVEGATRPAGALAAQNAPAGVIGEERAEIERVAVVPVAAAQPAANQPTVPASANPASANAASAKPVFAALAFATPANLHVYEFDWSADSRSLAYVAAEPPGENNWWTAKLYTQPIGGAPAAILAPAEVSGPLHGLQIAVPRWSPDGKWIAFIGGLMSDQGATGGDLWMVPARGGQPRNLTPKRPASVAWMAWADARTLYFSELAQANSQLVRLRLRSDGESAGEAFESVYSAEGTVSDGREEMNFSSTADRSLFVFEKSSFDHAPEIFALRNTSFATPATQISHFNDGVKPAWGKAVSLEWSNEGFHVQGWLLLPAHYNPAKKYPLLVHVHGGPASATLSRWNGGAGGISSTAFSALDYFVLLPNPRGSFGQGEAFTQANRQDFGYGDLRDILAGVDAVLARYPVDPHRVGITGWSYGGFMSMFAVTQTHRFRAAVAGAGISDWLSYYGENSIDQWMIPYFGASAYDAPAVYGRSSAINFIKGVATPTLTVVGDRDGECPAPQSFEFWHALRDLHVPSQLVVYPNEGHGFIDSGHRRDVLERAVGWFDRFMPPQ
jgi:dipeptidyl aminopeptidase/acylaminoacyl peptidase